MDLKVVPTAKGERRRSVDTYMNSMSSTIENGLQRQAALPHFLPHFHRILTEFNSLKIPNFELPNYSRIFLNSEFGAFFDENLPNLIALEASRARWILQILRAIEVSEPTVE